MIQIICDRCQKPTRKFRSFLLGAGPPNTRMSPHTECVGGIIKDLCPECQTALGIDHARVAEHVNPSLSTCSYMFSEWVKEESEYPENGEEEK